jgi:hypothetical protein
MVVLMVLVLAASCVNAQWRRSNTAGPAGFVQVGSVTLQVGGGINISTDNGKTWLHRYSDSANYSFVDMQSAVLGSYIFLGAVRNGYRVGGVYRSADTGMTWLRVSEGLSDTDVYSLGVCGSRLFAGTGTGAFVSTNMGESWEKITLFPTAIVYYFASVGNTILAGSDKGLFRSADSGATWFGINTDFKFGSRYSSSTLLASGSMVVANAYHPGVSTPGPYLFLSSDAGVNWSLVDSIEITDMIANNGILYRARNFSYGNVTMSTNDGRTWTDITDTSIGQSGQNFHRAVYLTVSGPNLIVATVNTGTWYRPLVTILNKGAVRRAISSDFEFAIHPNPLSSSTAISFSTQRRSVVEVRIVDVLGKECAQLFKGELDPGTHSYEWKATTMTAGVYFCTVRTENGIVQLPMIVQH